MALCSYWMFLWSVLLLGVSADPPSPHYVLHHKPVPFEQAVKLCSPGVLTTLSTLEEANHVLDQISGSIPAQDMFTFWVGLRKARNECVVPELPLRGFRWLGGGNQESQLDRWMEEPQRTCTTTRCAALRGHTHHSTVTTWGLIPISCRHSHPFICKLRSWNTVTPRPATPEPEPENPQSQTAKPELENPEPQTTQPQPENPDPERGLTPENPEPDPKTSELRPSEPDSSETKPGSPEPGEQGQVEPESENPDPDELTPGLEQIKLTELDPGPGSSLGPVPALEPGSSSGPNSGPEHGPGHETSPGTAFGLEPGPEPALSPASEPCAKPVVPGERSLSMDPDEKVRVRVECWSSVQLDLFCGGEPVLWRMLDGSVADLDEVCRPCGVGFKKDEAGQCQDVDECSSSPCRSSCVNTVGSFKCVCEDGDGNLHDDGAPACEGVAASILVPVVVAVSLLVLLVVIILVTVKCCMMRRSKKKEAEEEETGGGDSFQTANQKAAP